MLHTQPISLLSERRWQVAKRLLILFSENMTSITFSSSSVPWLAILGTTSTSFCGWLELHKVFGRMKFKNQAFSHQQENTEWTIKRQWRWGIVWCTRWAIIGACIQDFVYRFTVVKLTNAIPGSRNCMVADSLLTVWDSNTCPNKVLHLTTSVCYSVWWTRPGSSWFRWGIHIRELDCKSHHSYSLLWANDCYLPRSASIRSRKKTY